jgi:hypothetical protein
VGGTHGEPESASRGNSDEGAYLHAPRANGVSGGTELPGVGDGTGRGIGGTSEPAVLNAANPVKTQEKSVTEEAEPSTPASPAFAETTEPDHPDYSIGDTVYLDEGREFKIADVDFRTDTVYLRGVKWHGQTDQKAAADFEGGLYVQPIYTFEKNILATPQNIGFPDEPSPSEAEPEPSYSVGDVVYLENDRPFQIEKIGSRMELIDLPLANVYPISRSVSRGEFERLYRENPRNFGIEPEAPEPRQDISESRTAPIKGKAGESATRQLELFPSEDEQRERIAKTEERETAKQRKSRSKADARAAAAEGAPPKGKFYPENHRAKTDATLRAAYNSYREYHIEGEATRLNGIAVARDHYGGARVLNPTNG